MAAKLVNESKSEEIHSLFVKGRTENDELYYRCKEVFSYFKKNYVVFREMIFSQNLVVIKDGDNQIIVENMTKINSTNTVLIIRHMVGSKAFVTEAMEIFKKIFKNRHISKIKIVCFKDEIEKDIGKLEEIGFVKEIEYGIGENVRLIYSFKFNYD